MELMPELPIEYIKANQGLEKNSLDKRYFVCDKLLAIFASKKVNENNTKNTFCFEYGFNVRYRLYISQEDLEKEHSKVYVSSLINEMPSTRIFHGHYNSKESQDWLDKIYSNRLYHNTIR